MTFITALRHGGPTEVVGVLEMAWSCLEGDLGLGGSKLLRCIAVVPGQGHPFLPWLLNQEKGVGNVYFLRWLCELSEVPQVPIWVRGHLGKVSFC